MADTERNPFEGLTMLRPPGMHLAVACDGGMDLANALAATFFVQLHDSYPHKCLIAPPVDQDQLCARCGKPWDTQRNKVKSIGLMWQEWAYITDNEAFILLLIAGTAIEQVQRWIAWGSHRPYQLPHLGGSLVLRPSWVEEQFGNPDSPSRAEARQAVLKWQEQVQRR